MRTGFLGWLARTPVLVGFFVFTGLVAASFYPVYLAIDGALLDMIQTGEGAIVRLNEMDTDQRRAHFYGTVTLDVLYPIAYGGLLIGLLSRLAWSWRWLIILVPIIGVLADYAENAVQAMALSGHDTSILLAKDIVTPLKSGALMLSLGMCLLLGMVALIRRLSKRAKPVEDQTKQDEMDPPA